MKCTILTLVGVLVVVTGIETRAHHSYAEFLDEIVSVEGTVETLEFANPHTILTLRTKDAAVYTAIWRAVFQLDTMGVRRTDLKVGDLIVVSGTPSRDPAAHRLARLSEVRRPSDGWIWRVSRQR